MNKFKIILVISIFFFSSCKNTNEAIVIEQLKTNYPVVLRMSSKFKKIIGIKLPLKLKIKNNSLRRRSFIAIDYEYKSTNRNLGIELYREERKKLKRISNNKLKHIYPYEEEVFVFKSRHVIDSSKVFQKHLIQYVNKMLALKQDTLVVGDLDHFKRNNKDVFNQIVRDDLISIKFWNPKAGDKLNGIISVPVEW